MNDERMLTIVMYHYVRPIKNSRYPAIKGMELTDFRKQLAYLVDSYHPVSMETVVESVRTGDALPPRSVLLTFDDGYLDHFTNVFPILHEMGLSGAFFPPVSPVKYRRLLDVNRIHFILATAPDPQKVKLDLDGFIDEFRDEYTLSTPAQYWREYGAATRFDSADVIYIKRMLQHVLPAHVRTHIAHELFVKYVSLDEAAFADELYVDSTQLSLMQRCGMYIGSHGVSHQWLNKLTPDQQMVEIEGSIGFLKEIGSPVSDFWVMCFPYGGWDQSLLASLRARKCTVGLTTEVAVANLDLNDPLLLPRLDTNDILRAMAQLPHSSQ